MKSMNIGTTRPAPAFGLRIGLAIAALAVIAAVYGCGGNGAEQTSDATQGAVESGQTSVMPASTIAPSASNQGSRMIALGDSLPPDVVVTAEDSLFSPGDVVEITAQGSEDVSQVGLSDRLGRMQLFTREPASNLWHVLYRVPMGTAKDRLALSVTALNDLNRWRRGWLFLDVRQGETSAKPDSLTP